jgi:uncharacterized membrane protein YeaQ/YmgE (transglycosylase-associated protein family)
VKKLSVPRTAIAVGICCRHPMHSLDYETIGFGGAAMYLSNQSLLVILIVGIVAGWLAGRVMEGGGFGLIGDLIVGLIGAFIGDWLLPRIGVHLGSGIISLILNAFIGAVVLLLLLRLVGGGWGRRRWGRRW